MRNPLIRHIFVLLAIALIGCREEPVLFTYLDTAKTGIDFSNEVKNTEALNILNYLYFYNGAGVAAADFNKDGYTDLYFTSNQGADQLYLNTGNMVFNNITEIAGVNNATGWTTGVTSADIDGNGYADLYICKVSPLSPEGTHNLLYLNLGPDSSGIPQFREASAEFGLDFRGYSTQAAFFDQDLDGDLDMFLLNHSVHPNQNYGRGHLRDTPDALSGDRFYRNTNGIFEDDSQLAGIHSGKTGYGLGISLGDLNQDGYPDIYIGNDFFENDYLYINQGDGTFTDINLSGNTLGHTSHFSMGNDIADINNDLLPDIISVDMLPEDLSTYKTSGLEYPYQIYQNYLKNGYQPQFMQNTLHLNAGQGQYSETAYLSGIAASEWSWSPLLEDLDNDGYRDVFITNGIPGATNDMDFVNFIANEEIQKKLGPDMGQAELAFIEQLPVKKTANYIFRNTSEKGFTKDPEWNHHPASFSNGAVAVDLDNDNDLDLVVNNINEPAFIIENNLETGNALQIKFNGKAPNLDGIGSKVIAYLDKGQTILAENYPTKGYLSSRPANLHLGLGDLQKIDSVRIWWPDGSTELKTDITANTTVVFEQKQALLSPESGIPGPTKSMLRPSSPEIDFTHKDQSSLEFNSNPLIPFASTNLGPRVSTGDLNGDGLQDLCFGGAKKQPAAIYLQTLQGGFTRMDAPVFEKTAIAENTDQLIFDANGDDLNDILLVSGGNEFKSGQPLQPELYLQTPEGFKLQENAFKGINLNASRIRAADIDGDGDLDVCITANLVPKEYGKTPVQYLMANDGSGYFTDITESYAPALRNLGNVQDIVWTDLNNDRLPDLIAAGHWMPVSIFINTGSSLELQASNGLGQSTGWWNTLEVADIDNDGDTDIIAGNWGENSRLKASEEEPLKLYRRDMDNNGSVETIVSFYYQGVETPFSSKDELSKQMPFLNKKFLSYKRFANASMEDLFGKENLEKAETKKVTELSSCIFVNNGQGNFTKKRLPFYAQTSFVTDIAVSDLDHDGFNDLILVGNLYELSTQLGRADSNRGTILLNDQHGNFVEAGNAGLNGPMRAIEPIAINSGPQWIITRNNDTPLFIEPTKLKDHDPKK